MELNPITAMIRRRHPEYDQKIVHWNFLQATYNGGREWFKNNIFRYLKEGDQEYTDRLERAYRFNHSREIVDLINKYVFRGEIVRGKENIPECVDKFWKRSTRRNAGISTYMRYLSKLSSVYGRIWVVVDSVNLGTGESIHEADVKIYSYEVIPQNVLDMSFDEAGNLNWILLRETIRDDSNPFNCSGQVLSRYRLWTRTSWHLIVEAERILENGEYKPQFKVAASGDHNLGIVPVFPVDHMLSESLYTSPSLIDDIAYLDRAVANYLSNVDVIIQDQAFSQLAMPAQGLMPGEDQHSKLIEAGTKRIFTFDGESNSPPFFLSPDPKQAQMILQMIKQIINEIYHSVGVAGERTKQDNSMGIDNSSGVAKAFDFDRVNSLLIAKAASLQRCEYQLIDLVLRWSGEAGLDDSMDADELAKFVSYPTSFDARGLYDELDITNRIEMLTAPIELKRYQLKRVVEKLYPFMSEKDQKQLDKAIDDMEDATDALMNQFSGNNPDNTTGLPDDRIKNESKEKPKSKGQETDQQPKKD